jgi:NADH-quinone oxidoreductase subunit H
MNPTLQALLNFLQTWWVELVCAAVIVAIVPLIAAYRVLVVRKVMRIDPTLVAVNGVSHPIADAVKLFFKEDRVPRRADTFVFWLAPTIAMAAAFISMGALYFGPALRVGRDINIGVLFILGVSSLGFLGIIFRDSVSNRHDSVGRAIRNTVQFVSYEVASGLAIVSAVLLSGTLKIHAIVDAQAEHHVWFIFLAPIGFLTYFVASIVQPPRRSVDLPETGSELGANHMTECSGFRWSLYFLGEYANMIVVASVATTLFLGGWLRPFPNVHWLNWLDVLPALPLASVGAYCIYRARKQSVRIQAWFLWAVALGCFAIAFILLMPWIFAPLRFSLPDLNGAFWFLLKVSAYVYIFMWLRLTSPRFRYDQLMHLSWYILIPLTIVNVFSVAVAMLFVSEFGWNRWLAFFLMTIFTFAAAVFLVRMNDKRGVAANSVTTGTSDSYAR